jgi:hypothetical protein
METFLEIYKQIILLGSGILLLSIPLININNKYKTKEVKENHLK